MPKARSRRPEVFCKKGVLRNFTKFTGKHLCQSLFLTSLKKTLCHRCFPVNFAKFLRTPFFIEHLWWLFLLYLIGFTRLTGDCVVITLSPTMTKASFLCIYINTTTLWLQKLCESELWL